MKKFGIVLSFAFIFYANEIFAQCLPGSNFVNSNITTTTATIVINGTGLFYIEYGPAGFTPGTADTPGAGGTIVTLNIPAPYNQSSVPVTGLTPNTQYDIYNRQNCNGTYSVNGTKYSFMTATDCSAPIPLSCNTLVSTPHPGAHGAWYSSSCPNGSGGVGTEKIYSFTPANSGIHRLYLPANTDVLDYLYKPASAGCDATGWTCIGSNNNVWINEPAQFSFGPLTAGVQYFIRADCQDSNDPQVSSFRIECANASCITATNVTASNISTTSAVISWSAGGNGMVEYGPKGFIPGTGNAAGTNGTVTYFNSGMTLTGLTPNSEYDVYVRSSCGASYYSNNSDVITVHTQGCPPLTVYPITSNVTIFLSANAGLIDHFSTCYAGYSFPGQEYIIRFTAPSSGYFELLAENYAPGISFQLAYGSNCDLGSAYCLNPIAIDPGGGAIYGLGPLVAGVTYDIFLDTDYLNQPLFFPSIAFTIKCPKPSNIVLSNLQPTSVDINWTSCTPFCQSAPMLEYGLSGFTPGTGATAGVNGTLITNVSPPYNLTGLQPNTIYDVYQRTNCGVLFSANNQKTFRTPVDCDNAPVVNCGDYLQYCVTGTTAGFNGAWNINVCGNSNNQARESIWRFTPAQSGAYTLNLYGLTSSPLNTSYTGTFYIKADSLDCNALSWTCVGTKTATMGNFTSSTYSLGPLTAGVTYLILADGVQPASGNFCFSFQILCPGVCSTPSLTAATTTATSATLSGICPSCTGNIHIEYGVAGFTPGSGSVAGAGGTIISGAVFPATISGLTNATTYDAYARQDCGSPLGFSPNSTKITFTPCFVAPTGITSNVAGNTICIGSSITLTQSGGTLPSGGIYKWFAGACGTTVVGTGNSITVSPTATTTYRVRIESTCGNSSCTNGLTVTVTGPSGLITASGPTSFCSGGSVVLNAAVGTGYSYQWKNNGIDILNATNVSYTATASGSYTAVITNASGCSNTSSPIAVTVNSNPVVSFSGLASTYVNTDIDVTLTGSPAGGIFSGPGIAGNTFSPSAAGVGGPYTIIYSYTDANGCSNTASQQVTITGCTAPPALPGTITTVGGAASVCPGDTKTYTINPVTGATSYNWTPPNGGVITNGQGTVSVTINYTVSFTAPDTLRVVAVNNCGDSPQRKLNIFRNNPSTPGVITGEAYGLCNVSGVPYSVPAVAGMTYNWTFNSANGVVASGQGTNAITANLSNSFTTLTLSVTASNGCGTSNVRNLTLRSKPATPPSITGSLSVCANQQGVPYSITPLYGAANYTWTGPKKSKIFDGVVLSNSTTLITAANSVWVNYGNSGGILKVRGNNACGAGAYKSITVAMTCRESGISPESLTPEVSIFPNPAHDEINVVVASCNVFEVEVLNTLGERLLMQKNQSKIDISTYRNGVYFIRVICGDHVITQKIIKEK